MRALYVLVLTVSALLLAAPAASAQGLADAGEKVLGPYKIKRTDKGEPAESPRAAGKRFLDDLKERNAEVWASVVAAVRYEIHDHELQVFARQKNYVVVAYGVVWALLAAFAAFVFFRQRALTARIADLEAKLNER